MHGHKVDLWRYRATSGERNIIERIKLGLFLKIRECVWYNKKKGKVEKKGLLWNFNPHFSNFVNTSKKLLKIRN